MQQIKSKEKMIQRGTIFMRENKFVSQFLRVKNTIISLTYDHYIFENVNQFFFIVSTYSNKKQMGGRCTT